MPSHKGPFNQASVWFDPASGDSDTNVEPGDVNGTSESVAAGGTPSAHTFSAFTGDTSEIASYSSYMTNAIGSTGAAGSGLGPYTYTGHSDGNAFTHVLKALNSSGDIIGVAWHSVGLGSTGTGSYSAIVDLDLKDLTTVAEITSGDHTLQFDSSADELDVTVTLFSGNDGGWTPTNTSGLVGDGGTGSGSATLAIDIGALIPSWGYSVAKGKIFYVQIVCTGVTYPSAGNSDIFVGFNRGTTHNSLDARGFWIYDNNDSTNEVIRLRTNTSNSPVLATTAIKTSRVFTVMISSGEEVTVQDDSGTTLPTPNPSGSTAYTVGADSVSMNKTTINYESLYLFLGLGDQTDLVVERLVVGEYV